MPYIHKKERLEFNKRYYAERRNAFFADKRCAECGRHTRTLRMWATKHKEERNRYPTSLYTYSIKRQQAIVKHYGILILCLTHWRKQFYKYRFGPQFTPKKRRRIASKQRRYAKAFRERERLKRDAQKAAAQREEVLRLAKQMRII